MHQEQEAHDRGLAKDGAMATAGRDNSIRLMRLAQEVIRQCESELQGLVSEAARSGQYDAIERLTTYARTLHDMADKAGVEQQASAPSWQSMASEGVGAAEQSGTDRRASRRGRSGRVGYPRFARGNSDLVKIGWSKKKRQEYTHRAPRKHVEAIVGSLGDKGSGGAIIPTDEILSVYDGTGDEIPAYQTYLTLAWLRSQGVIKRNGRAGYSVLDPKRLAGQFDELWNLTPDVRAS